MSRLRTGRWRPALLATLALVAAGLVYASATLLAAAAIPLSYAAYGAVSRAPAPDLRVERTVERAAPVPGRPVEVELSVTNTGERAVPDCRVVDGIPAELAVVGGSARACLTLPAGATRTVTYAVRARRGAYTFEDPVVRLRSLAGDERETRVLEAEGDRTLRPAAPVDEPPLAEAPSRRSGTLPADTGGEGLAFHATREYRAGDPVSRVDWRHYAKTGEFVTVQYREQRAVETVLVVDGRDPARVAADTGHPTGAELAGYAAERLYGALDDAGLSVSATALGVAGDTPDGLPWVDGAADGPAHARRLFGSVGDDPAQARAADGGTTDERADDARRPLGVGEATDRLLARLPPTAQVVVCTPLLDDPPVDLLAGLAARGYPTLVLSPDVTGADRVGARLAALERRRRLDETRRTGAAAVSWDPTHPVDRAVRRVLTQL